MYDCFWVEHDASQHNHICRICEDFSVQNLRHGYNNLWDHIHKIHHVQVNTLKNKSTSGPMDLFVPKITDKAKNIHCWIEWIVEENLPLSVCENKNTKRNTSLFNITGKTLKIYMKLLHQKVCATIRDLLPPTFGLILDGWTTGPYHYSGIFATFACDHNEVVQYCCRATLLKILTKMLNFMLM